MIERSNYNLLKHNTFGLEAQCAKFVEYETADDAVAVAEMLQRSQLPLLIIGGGSNLLLTGNFNGVVVHSAIKGIEIVAEPEASEVQSDSVLLRCGSGETWDDVVAFCVEHGYYGAENLSLIPGEVGASAVQNIGAYGVEVSQIIERIEAVEIATGRKVEFAAAECNYGYRQSRFKQEWKNRYLVTYVSYRLQRSAELKLDYGNIRSELERRNIEKPTLEELRQTIIDIRNDKLPDPKKQGNAGSFFMNPVVDRETFKRLQASWPDVPYYVVDGNAAAEGEMYKIPAGWMIDRCGWKGRSLGNAGVHDRQALVLVNRGGASGNDIVRLCDAIRSDVKKTFGIDIHPEVNII